MRRRWIIGLVAGGCLAALIAVLALTGEREPRYQGKSLRQWLMIEREAELRNRPLLSIPMTWYSGGFDFKAQEAMRHLGTNALPWLAKWIASEPPAWRCNVYTQFCRLPAGLQSSVIKRLVAPPDPSLQELARSGFFVLTSNASPAISDLLRVIHQSKPGGQTRASVIECLGFMGEAARPAIRGLMSDPDPLTSRRARETCFDIDARSGRLPDEFRHGVLPNPPYYLERPHGQ